jgi:metallo-beta-lactamase family protein
MKLKFLGAARTVTGSFFLLETNNTRFAIDCGLFQGNEELKQRNYGEFIVDPKSIDFLILTHAHIDHSGLIPKLCKHGFKGTIYCSRSTQELIKVLLPDAGFIQESEVERKNRKRKRAGDELLQPIYTAQDATECLSQVKALNLDEIVKITSGIEVRLRDAGHILGSCIVEVWVEENGNKQKLVFTGDLGNNDQPIIKDPTVIESADYLIMESTYGDRYHKDVQTRREQLKQVIDEAMQKGGNLIIPSFAVERTQDLLYDLHLLHRSGELDPTIDIYIDSPLAIAATQIFQKSIEDYDAETRSLLDDGSHPLSLPNLKFSRTQEESMWLNTVKGHTIIISASGMCEAGRIKHHLKHNLWRPESTILFVGFQAVGTLGRRILDGEKLVKIHGEQVAVHASIRSIDAYSAHADRTGLISWVKSFSTLPHTIFLVHGEEQSQFALAEALSNELHIPVQIPEWQSEIDLTAELSPDTMRRPHTVLPDSLEKALKAEKMYLDLRMKLHNYFMNQWNGKDYDKIIESIKLIDSKLDEA